MKKTYLLLILITVLCLMVAFTAAAEGKPYEGQKVTILFHPTLYKAAGGDDGVIKAFEEKTGATVEVVLATPPEHTEKAMLDFISKTASFDVINFTGAELSDMFCANLLPLDSYIAANADYDFDDFIKGAAAMGRYGETQIAIPYRTTPMLTYYRSDLFAQAGLQPPTTWDDVYDIAKELTKDTDNDGKTDIYGFAAAGKAPDELAHAWLNVFYGYGGTFVNDKGEAGFDSEAGLKAATLWARLYQDGIFPADFFAWGRDDLINAMSQGRVAFGVFIGSYYANFFADDLTPEQIGYAPVPDLKNRSNGWYLAINKDSKNADLAWALVMELTNKENTLLEAVKYANGPARESAYIHPDYLAIWPQANELIISADNAVRDITSSKYTLMLEAITEEVTYVMQDRKTPEQGMVDLSERVNDLLTE